MAESHVEKRTNDKNVCKVCLKELIDEVQRCEKCRNLFHFDCCETSRETLDHDEEERVQHICFLCLDSEPEETQENLVQTQEKHGKSTYILDSEDFFLYPSQQFSTLRKEF